MSELDSPEADTDPSPTVRARITKLLLIWSFIALLTAVLVAAGARAWIQRTAVLKIRSLGGAVQYSSQCDSRGMPISTYGRQRDPWQIRKFIGDDVFDFPVAVNFRGSATTRHSKEQFLPLIAQLPRLRMVTLINHHSEVDDFYKLSRLRELKILILYDSLNYDKDLSMLQGLQLEWLALNHTPTSDRGLQLLEKMTSLKVLDLTSTRVTDQGLRFLEKLPNLKVLRVVNTAVTRENAERFMQKCPQCVVRVGR